MDNKSKKLGIYIGTNNAVYFKNPFFYQGSKYKNKLHKVDENTQTKILRAVNASFNMVTGNENREPNNFFQKKIFNKKHKGEPSGLDAIWNLLKEGDTSLPIRFNPEGLINKYITANKLPLQKKRLGISVLRQQKWALKNRPGQEEKAVQEPKIIRQSFQEWKMSKQKYKT